MIQPGTGTSSKKLRAPSNASLDQQFLSNISKQLDTLIGAVYAIFPHTPVAYTVGTTAGAPTNGQSTWTISTINVIGKNPVFLKNGVVQVLGTDYTFNNSTGVFTLSTGTFATSQVWTVLY